MFFRSFAEIGLFSLCSGLLALGVIGGGSITTAVTQSALQTHPAQPKVSPRGGVPTDIQEGVITDVQREHGKLFKGYGEEVTRGKKIFQLIKEKGDVNLIRLLGDPIIPRSARPGDFLQKLACRSDAIVIGLVKSKTSQLTEDGAFLFTDYRLVVENVLKNDPAAPPQALSEITLARAGGAVRLNGHIARAVDYAEAPLDVNGRYLLFLKRVSATGAYRSLYDNYSDGSFALGADKVTQVSDQPFPIGPQNSADKNEFMNLVSDAAARPGCGG